MKRADVISYKTFIVMGRSLCTRSGAMGDDLRGLARPWTDPSTPTPLAIGLLYPLLETDLVHIHGHRSCIYTCTPASSCIYSCTSVSSCIIASVFYRPAPHPAAASIKGTLAIAPRSFAYTLAGSSSLGTQLRGPDGRAGCGRCDGRAGAVYLRRRAPFPSLS